MHSYNGTYIKIKHLIIFLAILLIMDFQCSTFHLTLSLNEFWRQTHNINGRNLCHSYFRNANEGNTGLCETNIIELFLWGGFLT